MERLARTASELQCAAELFLKAAQAAGDGNMIAFRADFGRVAPHGYPTGPDAKALARASAPFPFRACGLSDGP